MIFSSKERTYKKGTMREYFRNNYFELTQRYKKADEAKLYKKKVKDECRDKTVFGEGGSRVVEGGIVDLEMDRTWNVMGE